MSAASPDSAWSDPGFVARRVFRRPTVPLEVYDPPVLSAAARDRLTRVARAARRPGGPAVGFVFGVMPRSGTNYLERLLLAHPDTVAAPDDLRELPFLPAAAEMREFEAALARFYPPNGDVFAPYEWLAYAMAGYLNAATGAVDATAQTVLVKDPHVRHIGLFDAVVPDAQAMIVTRDGRYLIDSTIRTWPLKRLGRTFEDVCLEWEAATRAALDYAATAPSDRVRLVRYEDLVAPDSPELAAVCGWLGLDPARLPADAVAKAPVLGSSTHSREAGGAVGWTPVARGDGFDPTGRDLDWSEAQLKTFRRICAATQDRAGYAL